ncbi:tripartite tricarboxylate transporter permease [Rhizobium rhizogenes]|uniref:tripartite tricarboxylate transporter permease n=1 Tax=Rhizobium rhizogenes TaxID=359 RepID=UPI001572D466|nr:tripartite tricarboxylate transporter permease [Rhizobium rhizogenes]NTI78479.1 tripartite tricarboxylate transporter permease [Rhizobium rhizogenes]
MSLLDNLALGFEAAGTLQNLGFALIGCLLGTLIGVLPGIGAVATVAMLLPISYGLEPLSGLIMLASIYYGAQYGGSTAAILLNVPGESSSVVTCIDGYRMAQNGRGGAALTVAALGSLFAGIVGTIAIGAFGPVLARVSQGFNSPEYFALMVFGLVGAVVLANGSVLKAVAMIFLGLLLGLVGTDITSGTSRYAFGQVQLFDGIGFVVLALAMFGFPEIILNLERRLNEDLPTVQSYDTLMPSREEFRRAAPASLRGTLLGAILGILPGGGGILASFASYALEKRISRHPQRFGSGMIEGVAGPESANNAAAQTAFIPMLTLGIPSHPVMALMMGAMLIHGIAPGSSVMKNQPELFWGMVASMFIGNVMLVIINLPLVGLWVRFLKVPYRLLYPAIVIFCCIGIYSVNYSTFEVLLTSAFAVLGYFFYKTGCEPAPFLLAFVLGPMMEENLRRSMMLARGNPAIFVERPICLALLVFSALLIVVVALPALRRRRDETFAEEGS